MPLLDYLLEFFKTYKNNLEALSILKRLKNDWNILSNKAIKMKLKKEKVINFASFLEDYKDLFYRTKGYLEEVHNRL